MSRYFDIPQRPFPTSQGDIQLPILYYNTACVFASFTVASTSVRDLLPDALEPVVLTAGTSIATIAFFQYVDSSVGPYLEMGLAVCARPSHRYRDCAAWLPRRSLYPGMYVVDLPVTTAIANAAGRECWGYPKIVTPIEFKHRGQQLSCAVYAEDGRTPLCRLEGRAGIGLSLPAPNLMTYTLREDTLLRTVIDMRGHMHCTSGSGIRLNIASDNHPLCQHLSHLDLNGQAPLLVQSGLGLKAILPAGEEVL